MRNKAWTFDAEIRAGPGEEVRQLDHAAQMSVPRVRPVQYLTQVRPDASRHARRQLQAVAEACREPLLAARGRRTVEMWRPVGRHLAMRHLRRSIFGYFSVLEPPGSASKTPNYSLTAHQWRRAAADLLTPMDLPHARRSSRLLLESSERRAWM